MVDIKSLMNKKGWTGDEVGRLMITDLVTAYKNALSGQDKSLLSDSDKSRLVHSLEKPADIKRYNEYRYVHEFLCTVPIRHNLSEQISNHYFWKLYHILRETQQAENENSRCRFDIKIVTQQEYDRMKQADFAAKMEWGYSVELLVLHTIDYYFRLYQNGKKTPYNKHFTASKKQPITNERIKSKYWADGEGGYYVLPDGRKSKDMTTEQWHAELHKLPPFCEMKGFDKFGEPIDETPSTEDILHNVKVGQNCEEVPLKWVDDLTAPADATMYDVLECLYGFYSSDEANSKAAFFELAVDYPEIYSDIWESLIKQKSLSFLKDVPKENYFDPELISCKDLYDNNVLDFKEWLEEFTPEGMSDIAVLQPSGMNYPDYRIDEKGNYKPQEPYWRKGYMSENLLLEHSEHITEWIEAYTRAVKEMYATQAAMSIIGDFIGVEDLGILIGNVNEDQIAALNNVMLSLPEDIVRYGAGENERPANDVKAELKELLKPIKIKDLLPSSESLEHAKRNVDFTTVQGNGTAFIQSLMRGGEDE